jgi:hypothetical protein
MSPGEEESREASKGRQHLLSALRSAPRLTQQPAKAWPVVPCVLLVGGEC